jgi:hypothetical protein
VVLELTKALERQGLDMKVTALVSIFYNLSTMYVYVTTCWCHCILGIWYNNIMKLPKYNKAFNYSRTEKPRHLYYQMSI